ncbi:MAG: endo-1,4-beta-xylanase [Acidobacteria bacterium]|nr:endo-1,4-beta-xylanase [Acidobacteriota bacterium]
MHTHTRRLAAVVSGLVLACVRAGVRGEEPTLKALVPKGLLIGVAVNERQIAGGDPVALAIVTRQFSSISPENILKWEAVHPAPDRYVFEPVDRYVAFGAAHGMSVIGHVLLWHHQTPAWVFAGEGGARPGRDELLGRLRAHINAVVGRYRGRIHGWDVVNEALEDDGTLRRSPWLALIGEDYVAKAFEYAHAADPQAELYYNDYNLWKPAKRDAAIRLVKHLRDLGLRIDGVGEQAHWGVDDPPLADIDATVGAVAAGTGLKVLLTELDVDVLPREPDMWGADLSRKVAIRATTNLYPNGLPDAEQRRLAQRYADIFAIVMKHRQVVSRVTLWGVTDAQSWLHDFPIPGRVNYPLLWDRQGRPKRAFEAVVEVLRSQR